MKDLFKVMAMGVIIAIFIGASAGVVIFSLNKISDLETGLQTHATAINNNTQKVNQVIQALSTPQEEPKKRR